jgi:hypothetical protein
MQEYDWATEGRVAMKRIHTTAEVIEILGGIGGVCGLTGAAYKRVWDWKADGRFPANYFLVMWVELIHRGYFAPPALWRQADAPRDKVALLRTAVQKRDVAA